MVQRMSHGANLMVLCWMNEVTFKQNELNDVKEIRSIANPLFDFDEHMAGSIQLLITSVFHQGSSYVISVADEKVRSIVRLLSF